MPARINRSKQREPQSSEHKQLIATVSSKKREDTVRTKRMRMRKR
jgi:hypothetical protein